MKPGLIKISYKLFYNRHITKKSLMCLTKGVKIMRRISCTFYRPENVKITEFVNIIGKMEGDLRLLCTEEVRSEDAYLYVSHLLSLAKPLEKCPGMYFMGLDEPSRMPSDARVDFFYMPTYIAAAIVIRVIMLHPELMEGKNVSWKEEECAKHIKEVFPGLLLGCTGRGFMGHGFDGLQGMIEAMRVFVEAGTQDFVKRYPQMCGKFSEVFEGCLKVIEDGMKNGTLQNEWGENYEEEAEEVLRLLENVAAPATSSHT